MRQSLRARVLVVAVAVLAMGIAPTLSAQTADELIAKNLAARGGLDKLKAITTMKMTGRLVTQGQDMQVIFWMKRPNLVLQEMAFQGQKMARAFDGQKGWTVSPFVASGAPQEIPGPQNELMKDNSDFDGPLVDYQAKGSKVELVGPDTVDGKKAYRLRVTQKNGRVTDVYLDAATDLEVKLVNEVSPGGGGPAPSSQKIKIETLLSNYKPVSGIQMPHAIKTLVNGQVQAEVTIDSIEVGIPIDDSIFKMPRKGASLPGGGQR
jgi:outer membrane lipoprotein-sorting protein